MILTVPRNKLKFDYWPNKEFVKIEIDLSIDKIEMHGDTLEELQDFIEQKRGEDEQDL